MQTEEGKEWNARRKKNDEREKAQSLRNLKRNGENIKDKWKETEGRQKGREELMRSKLGREIPEHPANSDLGWNARGIKKKKGVRKIKG